MTKPERSPDRLPLVSVVVIFFNQAHYVRRALGSVVNQTHRDLDIIVVDDGSEDATAAAVKRFQDERIRFFRKPNGGAASARNFGIRHARGDYIAFLDGDDIFLPHKIERQIEFLFYKNYPECVMTSGYYVVGGKKRVIDRRKPHVMNGDRVKPFSDLFTSCSVYHRRILEELGGFPEFLKINEDGALNALVFQRYPVYCDPAPLLFYQMNDAGKARRSLLSYSEAVSVMERRLEAVRPVLDSKTTEQYAAISKKNLLYGFLSCGNKEAAKRWFPQVKEHLKSSLRPGLLAVVSVKTNFNFYRLFREILFGIKSLFYAPVRLRYRKMLMEDSY